MIKILITGGAGYIGSVLVEELLKKGEINGEFIEQVIIVDNLMYKQACLLPFLVDERVKFIFQDVTDFEKLENLLMDLQPDIVIPLAAIVGVPASKKFCDDYSYNLNLDHVTSCGQYCKDYKKKLIYPNTNSGYGVGTTDAAGGLVYCTEDTPLEPISVYGKSKQAAEIQVLEWVKGVSLRLATVFGLSYRTRLDLLVNDFTYRAITDGFIVLYESHFKRNYIHVRDVVSAFIFAMENYEAMSGQAFNVGLSEANLSKRELCDLIKNYIPEFCIMESEIHQDPDKRNYIVSNDKIESLGWKPLFSVSDGIEEIIKAKDILKYSDERFNNL